MFLLLYQKESLQLSCKLGRYSLLQAKFIKVNSHKTKDHIISFRLICQKVTATTFGLLWAGM